MIYMVTIWYPPERVVDIAKLYLKQPRNIPFVKKWCIFNTYVGKDGMKQYHLIYTEAEKGEEAALGINKYFLPFANQVDRFRIESEVLMGVSESYKAIGMK